MKTSEDVLGALELGAKEPIAKVVTLVKRIWSHYKGTCTEREAAAAAGWTTSGGSSSRFFQSAVAYGLLSKTAGLYSVTVLGKRLVVGEIDEDTLREVAAILDTLYGVLEHQEWQHLDSDELLRKYTFHDVKDADPRVTAYVAVRPVWIAARTGNIDDFKRLLNEGSTVPTIRQRSRRSTFNDHAVPPSVSTEQAPSRDVPLTAPTVSLVPALSAAAPNTVQVLCQHCTGTGWVVARTR